MAHKDSATKKSNKRQRTRLAVSHEELIPGTALTASLKGKMYEALVVAGDAGRAEIEFGGKRYTSLSAAGSVVAGYAVNGWKFLAACRGAGDGVTAGGPQGRLSELIQSYILRCDVEGKSQATIRAYRETLERFARIARKEGFPEEGRGDRRRPSLHLPRPLHRPLTGDPAPLRPRGALLLQLAGGRRIRERQPVPGDEEREAAATHRSAVQCRGRRPTA